MCPAGWGVSMSVSTGCDCGESVDGWGRMLWVDGGGWEVGCMGRLMSR